MKGTFFLQSLIQALAESFSSNGAKKPGDIAALIIRDLEHRGVNIREELEGALSLSPGALEEEVKRLVPTEAPQLPEEARPGIIAYVKSVPEQIRRHFHLSTDAVTLPEGATVENANDLALLLPHLPVLPARSVQSFGLGAWLGAISGTFSPRRLLLCLIGLILSLLSLSLLLLFDLGDMRLTQWLNDLPGQLLFFQGYFFESGSRAGVIRALILLAPLSIIWCFIGAMIVRSEALMRAGLYRKPFDRALEAQAPTMVFLGPMALLGVCAALLPGLLLGYVNWALPWGLGTVVTVLFMPLAFLSSLLAIACLLCVTVAFPNVPSTIAIDGGDGWEAISRSLAYLLTNPLLSLFWLGLIVILSFWPVALVPLFLQEIQASPDLVPWVLIPVVVFSLSLFWSLQSVVYIKLRRVIDLTGESDVYVVPEEDHTEPLEHTVPPVNGGEQPEKPPQTTEEGSNEQSTPSEIGGLSQWLWPLNKLVTTLSLLALIWVTWWVCYHSLTWWGDPEEMAWARWALGPPWVPEASGLLVVASWIVAAYLVLGISYVLCKPLLFGIVGLFVTKKETDEEKDESR